MANQMDHRDMLDDLNILTPSVFTHCQALIESANASGTQCHPSHLIYPNTDSALSRICFVGASKWKGLH